MGTLRLDAIDRPETQDVWRLYSDQIEIDEAPLDLYLEETESAAILHVSQPVKWPRVVPLTQLRTHLLLEPPQSFRYLSIDQSDELERLGGVSTTSRPEAVLVG